MYFAILCSVTTLCSILFLHCSFYEVKRKMFAVFPSLCEFNEPTCSSEEQWITAQSHCLTAVCREVALGHLPVSDLKARPVGCKTQDVVRQVQPPAFHSFYYFLFHFWRGKFLTISRMRGGGGAEGKYIQLQYKTTWSFSSDSDKVPKLHIDMQHHCYSSVCVGVCSPKAAFTSLCNICSRPAVTVSAVKISTNIFPNQFMRTARALKRNSPNWPSVIYSWG